MPGRPCFPRTDASAAAEASNGVGKKQLCGAETILVAEDHEQVRRLVGAVLRRSGYRVLEASDGPEAERVSLSLDGPIHLLLTDVVMTGMNGRRLYERIRKDRPDIQVLYMSGYARDVVVHQGIVDAGVELLQKPFTAEMLSTRVREILDHTASDREHRRAGHR